MLMLVVVVAVACGVITSAGIFFLYILTRFEFLLSVEVHGFLGVLCALAVAVARRLPDALLVPGTGLGTRGMPLALLALSALCKAAGLRAFATDFPFVCVGSYVGWAYLRFVHVYPDGMQGDISTDFELVNFLPAPVRPMVKPMCDFAFGVLGLLGLFQDRARRQQAQQDAASGKAGLPLLAQHQIETVQAPRDPVAERRRARAMQLLNDKFAKLNS
ncbi:unnamed protein product, partial [Phaeothamnion confervicola]